MSWLTRLTGPRPDPQAAAKIMTLACPLCEAEAGEPCDPWSEEAGLARPPCGLCGDPPACPDWCDAAAGVVVLGGDPLAVLHTGRLLAAIGAGLVSQAGVLARFGDGEIPPSLTHRIRKPAQEARA